MPITYEEAYDGITNRLIDEWATNAANIVGNPIAAPELRFTGNEVGAIPKTYFARFTMNPVLEGQSTHRNGEGNQRYTAVGNIFLQVFSPRSDERATEYGRKLAVVGRDIFRGKRFASCIWFRNVRINWLDPEEKFLRANVVGEYEYDEVG